MMREFLRRIERFLIVAALVAAFVAMVGVKSADLAVSIGAGIFALLCGGGIHLVQMAIARRDAAIQQATKTAPVLPAKIYYTRKYAPILAVGTIVFALVAYGAFDLGRQGGGIVFSFMGIVGLISFLKTVVRNGQPALVIDESGIVANNYGLIPWSIIERVLVSFNNSSSFHHELRLWLSDFEKIRRRQGLLVRGGTTAWYADRWQQFANSHRWS
jgi:hypothetical protein